MKYLIITMFISQSWGQWGVPDFDVKPDVTFDDHNERFDVSSIVSHQNRLYDNANFNEFEEDSRRQAEVHESAKELREKVKDNEVFDDFAAHNLMDSDEKDEDFEKNLDKFKKTRRLQWLVNYLHGQGNRRSGEPAPDPVKEVLFHHAVPIDLTINGYLQVPLVE